MEIVKEASVIEPDYSGCASQQLLDALSHLGIEGFHHDLGAPHVRFVTLPGKRGTFDFRLSRR
jgi:hypothetical protein